MDEAPGQRRCAVVRGEEPRHRALPASPADRIAARVVALRERHPHLGPKKIRAVLTDKHPDVAWPAVSTIGDILKRAGLVTPTKRRRRPLAQGEMVAPATEPNEEWSIDFKGWFRTADGTRCDPLTIADAVSRYLIEVEIVAPTWAGVRGALERVFERVGLPGAIRSDNGAPFGSTGAGGLSALSVWWLKLGIVLKARLRHDEPRYISPSSPQDNGRHERMHRTLKAETSKPPAATPGDQQARFDAFRRTFNEERPHEALGQVPPARRWTPPGRTLPPRLDEAWYDADHEVRRVRPTGEIKWQGEHVFIGQALAGELAEHATGGHIVRFMQRDLGLIGRDGRFLRLAPPRARLRSTLEPAE